MSSTTSYISKIEAGKIELESILFDIHALIETSVLSFAPAAMGKNLELNMQIHPDIPRLVIGDPTKLRQVFNNLISNALKFTDKGGVSVEAA
jgi:signal transduction histidine kinase